MMAWVRLDDGYPEHPKVDRVGPMAAWLNVCAWAYCARNLTDGFVPESRVARLAALKNVPQLTAALVGAHLWEEVEGGYRVHDYLAYNPSRDAVLKDRSTNARRVAEWREQRVSNSITADVTPPVTSDVTPTVSNGVSTSAPYPAPTRLRPKETPLLAATQPSPPPSLSDAEMALADKIGAALGTFGFRLEPGLWRKVFDLYSKLDLETEAFKQADWLRRNRVKTCSASRYTNWLNKALGDHAAREPESAEGACTCAEVRRKLEISPNVYRFCDLHGRVEIAKGD